VKINRRKTRLKVTIDRGKTGKDNGTSSAWHVKLNLNSQSNVIHYGGGPPEVLRFAKAMPLSFKGFLKQFHFEEFNVLDDALGDDARLKGFSITDEDRVSRAWPSNQSCLKILKANAGRTKDRDATPMMTIQTVVSYRQYPLKVK